MVWGFRFLYKVFIIIQESQDNFGIKSLSYFDHFDRYSNCLLQVVIFFSFVLSPTGQAEGIYTTRHYNGTVRPDMHS